MPGPKFLIYGGGKWREVDLEDGRVSGWGHAKFVYYKRGKIRLAKSKHILPALRDLAAGKRNSVMKNGPCLLQKRTTHVINVDDSDQENSYSLNQSQSTDKNRSYNNDKKCKETTKVDQGSQCAMKVDACIQTSHHLAPELANPLSQKRKYVSSSSDEDLQMRITTNALVHTKNSRTQSSENATHSMVPSLKLLKTDKVIHKQKIKSREVWVVDNKNQAEISREHSILSKNKQSSKSSQGSLNEINNFVANSTKPQSKSTATQYLNEDKLTLTHYTNKNENHKQKRGDLYKELMIEESDVEILRKFLIDNGDDFDLLRFDSDNAYKKLFFYKINPLVTVERCHRIARMLRNIDGISLKDFAYKLGLRSISEVSTESQRYKMRKIKQTVTVSSSDSKCSNDNTHIEDKHKRTRGLNRSEIENLNRNSINSISESDGASSIRSFHKKLRKSTRNSKSRGDTNKYDQNRNRKPLNELKHKQSNIVRHLLRHKNTGKFVKKSEINKVQDNGKNLEKNDVRERNIVNKTSKVNHLAEVNNTAETLDDTVMDDGPNMMITDIRSLATKPKHTISKRACRAEYSSLEDHAIVSWVSNGHRSRSVNGNRIWRQLQDSFTNITGKYRSWHSLRNRYLRYILPSLGAMALPAADAARLRADAATGEIKTRRRVSRRNSIFAAPARGAFTRAHNNHNRNAQKRSKSPSPTRVLRSSSSHSPGKSPGRKESPQHDKSPTGNKSKRSNKSPRRNKSPKRNDNLPRYSDIVRHFTETHKQSNSSPNETPTRSPENSIGKKKSDKQKNLQESKKTSQVEKPRRVAENTQKSNRNVAEKKTNRSKHKISSNGSSDGESESSVPESSSKRMKRNDESLQESSDDSIVHRTQRNASLRSSSKSGVKTVSLDSSDADDSVKQSFTVESNRLRKSLRLNSPAKTVRETRRRLYNPGMM